MLINLSLNELIDEGRVVGQKHPRIDWIYMDGQFPAHKTVCHQFYNIRRGLTDPPTLDFNFLLEINDPETHQPPASWRWI